MKVIEIRQETELEPLEAGWHQLCKAASTSIFLSWEWVTSWWSAYGTPGELRVTAVFDDLGILRGIAPMRSKDLHRYGQTAHALGFIGDAPVRSDSDYLDFIIEPGYKKEVIESLLQYWGRRQDGPVLELNEIPASSPNLEILESLRRTHSFIESQRDVECAAVSLPSHWDEYLRTLQPRFRTKIRSVLKNLEGRGEVQFGFCKTVSELEEMLPVLFDLHARRWAQAGKPGVFGCQRKRDFYRTLSSILLDRGWLRMSWLKWNERILAVQYGFVYGGVYSQLQEGYEPASEHWNVGVGLRAWSVRELIKEGVREYDFLGGVSRHKKDWGAGVKQSKRILLGKKTGKNLLLIRGPEWENSGRKRLRRIIPESILALRRRMSEPATPNATNGTSRFRGAAAAAYVHSGMPTLMRRVRDRYQLSTANGQIRWQKRSEAAGRIFYYHRVNDDNDPFLPAIPTASFDAQMRYLAQHYKVVSLGELMRHLEEGESAEAVVAITFDDGYSDNYHKAFPILERYRLPATIFLATGSIDSGEPLWFGHLAEALKKTGREFIDIEIDLPRRFWTRTLAERLAANEEIFQLLRQLSDSERRLQLRDILKQLGGTPSSERKTEMLTWDEARLMNANRIDFGGHTVTHPFLSRLDPAKAAWEVSECKRRIEEELQKEVEYFAYPNGREQDLGGGSKELLRAAGYLGAVTTIWGMNYRSTDPMELRRGGPWENSAALFASKLDWYQMVNQ